MATIRHRIAHNATVRSPATESSSVNQMAHTVLAVRFRVPFEQDDRSQWCSNSIGLTNGKLAVFDWGPMVPSPAKTEVRPGESVAVIDRLSCCYICYIRSGEMTHLVEG